MGEMLSMYRADGRHNYEAVVSHYCLILDTWKSVEATLRFQAPEYVNPFIANVWF